MDERYDVAEASNEVDRAAQALHKHKHMFEVYRALRDDPDIPAPELAVRVGLITRVPPEDAPREEKETARKAIQNAWQLRGRTLRRLKELLES